MIKVSYVYKNSYALRVEELIIISDQIGEVNPSLLKLDFVCEFI